MPKSLRVVIAVLAGLAIGSAINMGIIVFGGKVVAPPAGADVTTMEGLKASLHLFEPRHFAAPFLAHALGTFGGALIAALSTPVKSASAAYIVGGLFLLGGIANVVMLPAPAWFSVTDLLLAYLPMAWLGQRLALRARRGVAGASEATLSK